MIGVDPKYITYSKWQTYHNTLKANHKLISIETNLIDLLWPDKPAHPNNPVKPLPLKFSGKSACDKLTDIRKKMGLKNATSLLITALDEIAWTLNLRGSDIEYNPVFFSYLLINETNVTLFIDKSQVTPEITSHLDSELGRGNYKVEDYDKVSLALQSCICKSNSDGMVWMTDNTNYQLASLIPKEKLITEATPSAIMKTIKNKVEIAGMKNAHIRDAAALICYISWLEKNLGKSGDAITEVSGATKLEEFRAEQENFIGLSFDTISSVGPHAAIIHYKPDATTDVPITTSSVYLCDSGGQYLDGTTDITRTMHFGTPTAEEKQYFTLVLKGVIGIATSVFPEKTKGITLDSFARKHLWNLGLDYRHGTGHGVGAYLNVHEGPIGIHYRYNTDDPGLRKGMFLSNEPGYYEEGKFGFRHEDVVLVVEAKTQFNFNNVTFLTFETVSLVPIQRKMIVVELLTKEEIEYINDYHKKCRDVVGPILKKQSKEEGLQWLLRETEPITV